MEATNYVLTGKSRRYLCLSFKILYPIPRQILGLNLSELVNF